MKRVMKVIHVTQSGYGEIEIIERSDDIHMYEIRRFFLDQIDSIRPLETFRDLRFMAVAMNELKKRGLLEKYGYYRIVWEKNIGRLHSKGHELIELKGRNARVVINQHERNYYRGFLVREVKDVSI